MADVYRSVDEDGNVIFIDQPTPGAEMIETRDIPTIEAPPPELPDEASLPLVPTGEAGFRGLRSRFPLTIPLSATTPAT